MCGPIARTSYEAVSVIVGSKERFCKASCPESIWLPAISTGSNPGAVIFKLYSEYGWFSPGSIEYSKGGVSNSITSVCPDKSVFNTSNILSGSPAEEISTAASVIGRFPRLETRDTCKVPTSGIINTCVFYYSILWRECRDKQMTQH